MDDDDELTRAERFWLVVWLASFVVGYLLLVVGWL